MSGNFALLNLTDQIVTDLQEIFGADNVTLPTNVAHDGSGKQPNVPWTAANQSDVINAFGPTKKTILRASVPRHKYVVINNNGSLSTADKVSMANQLDKAKISHKLSYPDIGLKVMPTNNVSAYGDLWDKGYKAHALVAAVSIGDVSIEYFQYNGAWV